MNSKKFFTNPFLSIAGLLLTLFAPSGFADGHQGVQILKQLQVHGFLSQGYIKTTGNNVFGHSNNSGSFDFREMGLTASLRPLPRLQFSGQLLHRRAGEGSDGGIRIDFGFLDYNFINTPGVELGLRLGRMKNPFGFYNDTRDVPFTRPSILLPQSIYFDRTRNLALASDGAQLYGESRTDWGNITIQLGAAFPQVDDKDTETSIFGHTTPIRGYLKSRLSYIGRILYELPDGRLRLAVSSAQLNVGYDPSQNDIFESGSFRFSPLILSAQYNAERWSITSEYALRYSRRHGFGNPRLDQSSTGDSFYLQGIYRFLPGWEAVLRYDLLFANRKDRNGKKFAAVSGHPAYSQYARDLTVGLRWNITPSIMLSTEYHRINGTAWLSPLDNPDITSTKKNWNLFAAQISYRF
ncbi:hypothetical protein [Nitrosomonas eutropha]|uniref:hypothetical protein n=1 Tax=Nitrosomonas eutropha TaxID=916 RepID=UPI0008971ED9|nr:hypothetical protein [Nitrosomonas eutropha]SDW34359.1 hypothetical protein SAMN05216317_104153 [Nitrosomonas eutropha]SEI86137.1 hypothetical protein SAMN05216318_11353 [Nitrosomonas eutropha]